MSYNNRYNDRRDDRRDDRGQYNDRYDDRRDGNESRQSGSDRSQYGGSQYGGSQHGGSQYGGSQYSQHSGDSRRGGRADYGRGGSRGGGRGGHQNGRDDLSHQMGRMNMNSNIYSQHGNPRCPRPVPQVGDLAGSAHQPRMPIPKKDLAHNTQKFAERPDSWVYDKKAVGTKTTLLTNHALVHLPEQTVQLYCYNIEIFNNKKLVNNREQASPLFHAYVRKFTRDFPNRRDYVFNDVNILWTSSRLPKSEGRVGDNRSWMMYKYTTRFDFGQTIREDQDKQLLSTLVDAIATARVRSGCPKFTVFKRCMFMIGDGTTDNQIEAPLSFPVGQGLDARCGISIGVRINLRAGVTACYDISHTIFNRPGYPLIRLLCELINAGPISDEEFEEVWDERLRGAVMTERNFNELDRILKKMKLRYSLETAVSIDENGKVIVKKIPRDPKDFKYYQLTATSAQDTTFRDDKGKTWSIAEYFLEVSHIRLRYPNLPCFVKKPSKQNTRFIAFPMEFVSYVTDAVRYEGNPGDRIKMEMIRQSAYTASQRRALLQHIIEQKPIADVPAAIDNNDSYMRNHGLSIEKEMLSVKATILPPPTVVYGEGSKFTDVHHIGEWEAITHDPIRKVLEGSVYVRNKDGPQLKKRLLCSVIHISSPENGKTEISYDPACYHRLMNAIEEAGQPVAWENYEERYAAMHGVLNYCQGADDPYVIMEFFQNIKANIDNKYKQSEDEVIIPFVLLVFQIKCSTLKGHRDQWDNDYNFIKYLGDSEVGIYTQGILAENLCAIKETPAICKLTRLLVEKILGKVGTTHRKLEREGDHKSWTKLTDPKSPTLVLGVDVSHPSPRDRLEHDIRKLSVATVVGNIDFDCTEYRASSRIQDAGEENIVRFREEITARLNAFIQNTGVRPKHIVVYRDGICEGDFQRILYEERINIEQCCVDMDPGYQPTITYIVVSKRHHTRFFLKDNAEGHESQGFNVLPGTLVEDTVTTKEYYDFYLTSQIGQLGVAHPTHYYVLHDTWKPMVSFWPTVTHALTYMFCRATSTVSLPAPVLYAHLAAKRAKECLDGAWTVARFRNMQLSVDSFHDVNKLTQAININAQLDGMTFV
uniref:Piwi domain-containing protein n=1 Tax=Caenorhabditis tropicalis TaxID=1561998 RepID=A0A1I7U2G9_9PELO